LENDEHKHIKNILEFAETIVEEIMTPRINFDKLSDDITVKEAIDYVLSHTHSRIPVYHKEVDKIV
jgi:CBS domain containing-hemolysin-like protein